MLSIKRPFLAQKGTMMLGVNSHKNAYNLNNFISQFEISENRILRRRRISIGNHMISSAIWDRSARVNFSKAN